MALISIDDPTFLTILFGSIIIASRIIYLYSKKKLSYWKNRGVDQLTDSHWLFGDFKDGILFRNSPGLRLGQIYMKAKRKSKILGFYIFHKPCLMLLDPEIIKQIFITDFKNFTDRNFAGNQEKDSIGMRNLFGLKNPTWKYLRQKISPTFSKSKLKQMLPLMLETGQPMMEYIEKQKSNEEGVKVLDVQDLNIKYATDLIANIALGAKTDSFHANSKYTQAVSEFFHSFKRMVALVSVFFMPDLVDWMGSFLYFNSGFIDKIFWDAIDHREKTGESRGDYIDTIIELKNGKQNSLYRFEGKNLLYQSGAFFSGFESSSTTAAFTLLELGKNPTHQAKAREEIRRAVEEHGWSYEAFNSMKYLEKCISEGLRIHPQVSTLDRKAIEDYQIPGTDIVIEKGTAVYISLYGLQKDPRYFEDPDAFNPDRFDDDQTVITDAFLPFGAGPRMCVGVKLGQMYVKVVLALLLSQYEMSYNVEKTELDPRSTFTAAVHGINMEFRKLGNAHLNAFLINSTHMKP